MPLPPYSLPHIEQLIDRLELDDTNRMSIVIVNETPSYSEPDIKRLTQLLANRIIQLRQKRVLFM